MTELKLGGWHRLWMFTSVLYLLAVLLGAALLFPTPRDIRHSDALFAAVPDEYASALVWPNRPRPQEGEPVQPPALRTFTAGERAYDSEGRPRIVRRQLPDGRVELEPPEAVKEITQPASNGHVLRFWPDTDEATLAAAVRTYEAALHTELRQQRWAFARWTAALWLVPCLAAYALGWAVGWVYRGFTTP